MFYADKMSLVSNESQYVNAFFTSYGKENDALSKDKQLNSEKTESIVLKSFSVKISQKIHQEKLKLKQCNKIIYSLASQSKIQNCWILIDQMQRHGINPDDYSYNPILMFYIKNNDMKAVELTLKRMHETGIYLSCIDYTSLINLCIKRRDLQKGIEYYEKMRSNGIEADLRAFNAVLFVYIAQKNFNNKAKITEIYDEMEKNGIGDQRTYDLMTDFYFQINDEERAELTFNRGYRLQERIEGNELNLSDMTFGSTWMALKQFLKTWDKKKFFIQTINANDVLLNKAIKTAAFINNQIRVNFCDLEVGFISECKIKVAKK